MRSGNPVLSNDVFRAQSGAWYDQAVAAPSGMMTLQGTVAKTGILLALTIGGAAVSWMHSARSPDVTMMYLVGGSIVSLAIWVWLMFSQKSAGIAAPIFAVAEGVSLGALSMLVDALATQRGWGMIVPQAVALTFGTLGALLAVYSTGTVRPSAKFKAGVLAAMGGIALIYGATVLLSFFGISVPYIHGNGIIGIGFSLVVVVVCALMLVLDFDLIESGVAQGAPKYMEWYCGYALLMTLIWLYIEFLRLLMKLQSRND